MGLKARTTTFLASAALLAAGTAAVSAGTAAAAEPGIVHPFSASKCGSTYCVEVYGTGLHVDYEVVTRADTAPLNAYVYAQDDNDGYFKWSGKTSQVVYTLNIDRSFSNKSSFCGGGAPSPQNADYANGACVTIHS
jgi:hypothetical protein